MEVFSSNTADVIRYDFVKFNRSAAAAAAKKEERKQDAEVRESLEQLRAEMENDNGLGSYGSYKCPLF